MYGKLGSTIEVTAVRQVHHITADDDRFVTSAPDHAPTRHVSTELPTLAYNISSLHVVPAIRHHKVVS